MNCTRTQGQLILRHLRRGWTITPLQALRIAGSMKLSTRIGELKKAGARIDSEFVTIGGKRVKRYWLDA